MLHEQDVPVAPGLVLGKEQSFLLWLDSGAPRMLLLGAAGRRGLWLWDGLSGHAGDVPMP